ncbi:hypothetical protein K501DRAFT_202462 [Backusella circina FSU 941]|nr:hypothetical protein K501DRAFT_202462 [Backusella circina FSU 941]
MRRHQYYQRYYEQTSRPTDKIRFHYWNDFWSSNLHHTSRNVWYRLIHNKIPNPALLNCWIPHTFRNPYCHLCYTKYHPPELPPLLTNNRWFFDCPFTRPIWEST